MYLFQSMILIISCHDIVQMPIQICIPLHMFSIIIIVEKLAFKSHYTVRWYHLISQVPKGVTDQCGYFKKRFTHKAIFKIKTKFLAGVHDVA